MRTIIKFLVERGLLVNLISVSALLLGLFAMVSINREAFPNVNLDRIQIDSVYPGATPEEVERLVIIPVEKELRSLTGIDKMTSVSFPGSGRILLELDPYATNRERIASDVQLAVDRAVLPEDLPDEPSVLEIDGSVFPVLRLTISAPRTPLELKRLGDKIEDDLIEIDGVASVVNNGERKAELRVVVDPAAMQKHRISVGEIADLLKKWNVNASGGEIDTSEGQKAVRIVGEFRDPSDAAELVVRANERGGGIRLKDIATVTESLEKARVYYDVEGKPAISLIVLKKTDADIIETVDRIYEYIKVIPERYGEEVRVNHFQDFSQFARLRLGVLTNNGMVGLVMVFVSLILFLRPSVAFTTTIGLPIVFMTGLYFLYINGTTLNLISMMGFIIVLGMLVDDAIIIGENITYHMEQGMPPAQAAVTGAIELLGPVTTTVMTTIIAFLPMMFMSGIIGKFIIAIPIVVMSLLFFSWLESFLILPSHVVTFAKTGHAPKERKWLVRLEDAYAKVLGWAIRHHWLTVGAAILVLFGSLILSRVLPFQLFPPVGVNEYMVRVTSAPGTSVDTMRQHLIRIDAELRKDVDKKYLEATLLSSGQIAIDEGDPLTQRGGRFGQIRVIYIPSVLRPDHNALDDMRRASKKLPSLFPDLKLAFTELRQGPPVGRPLQVEIASYDKAASEKAARQLMEYLGTIEGVTSYESGLEPGDPELHIVFNKGLAAYAGINLQTAASHVRAAVDGLRVSTTRKGTEEVDVTIRFPESAGVKQMEQLKTLLLPNERGGLVPLSRIAKIEEHGGYTTVRHKTGIRVINVVADIDSNIITSAQINAKVEKDFDVWAAGVAGKIKVNYGGEEEKNQESIQGLVMMLGLAMIGIFFILAIQFNNMKYPIVVMMAIPFGVIGILIAFVIHDALWRPMPLSFFSLLGMVALSGVVVNSALVLIVFIQRLVHEGTPIQEAIIISGRRRLRAVLLTATTTVVGLLPTAYGWGGMDLFVSPMALALSSGLAFATLITLLVIPAMLLVGHDSMNALRQHVIAPVKKKMREMFEKDSGKALPPGTM